MQFLFAINDPPYGTERTYNALRHANALAKAPDTSVKIFLMADAVQAARRGQTTPTGYYNLERRSPSPFAWAPSAGPVDLAWTPEV